MAPHETGAQSSRLPGVKGQKVQAGSGVPCPFVRPKVPTRPLVAYAPLGRSAESGHPFCGRTVGTRCVLDVVSPSLLLTSKSSS